MVEWKEISNLGDYFGGLTGKTKKDFENGNAKFITYMNVFSNPSLDVNTVGMVHINEGERQNKVQKGDILFSGSSETHDEAGMSCVVTDDLEGDYYMNSFCFGLRLNNPELYNLHYFKHVLRSYNIRQAISKTASGVTRFNISKARFGKVQIPIPSLEEQKRIVGILDTFTDSIENLKQQIAQRRKQFEFYRDQLLDLEGKEGVEMKTLGELSIIVTKQTGFDYSSKIKPALQIKPTDNSIPFLQTKNFTGRKFDYNTDYYVPTHIVNQFPKIVLDKECLLLSIVGASIGNVGLFPGTTRCFLGGAICVLKFHEVINVHYIYEIMSSWYGQKLIRSKTKGAGQATITVEDIRNFSIPLPSAKEQSRIVSILDTFEASISNLEAQLAQRQKQYEYYRNQLLTFE